MVNELVFLKRKKRTKGDPKKRKKNLPKSGKVLTEIFFRTRSQRKKIPSVFWSLAGRKIHIKDTTGPVFCCCCSRYMALGGSLFDELLFYVSLQDYKRWLPLLFFSSTAAARLYGYRPGRIYLVLTRAKYIPQGIKGSKLSHFIILSSSFGALQVFFFLAPQIIKPIQYTYPLKPNTYKTGSNYRYKLRTPYTLLGRYSL